MSTRRPSSLAAASPDALLVVDAGGRIDRVGGDCERLLGWPAGELQGRSIAVALDVGSQERLLARLPEVLEAGPSSPAVVLEGMSARRRDGSSFPTEAVLVVLEPQPGGEGSVLVTLRDDTRSALRREAQQQARERLESSNRDLEAFASIAAHDLQEPLRKVRAFTDRARVALLEGDPERGGAFLDRVEMAAVRMQGLIDDLLLLSRVSGQEPDRQPVELEPLVQVVAEELLATADGDARVEIDGDLPTLEADPVRIRQLLQNLVGNGLKFRRPDVAPVVRISAEPAPDGWVRVTVSDNGIGFDDRYTERIFKPFERLHGRDAYGGSGVGLALCRAIVETHGGTLDAHGTPGEGASFTAVLPAIFPS